MTLTVLSKQNCMACRILKNHLDSKGINFKTIDVEDEPDAVNKYGITSVPVTVLENETGELGRAIKFDIPAVESLVAQLG